MQNTPHSAPRAASQRGFSFVEILVVMAIISVLMSAVVVVVPMVQEKASQTQSKNNVKNMIQFMLARGVNEWPPASGKNFVLYLVATRDLDYRNPANLETLFSPGDMLYTLEYADIERYKSITKKLLIDGADFHELTSYAGRRNGRRDQEYRLNASELKLGTLVICDDDDGALHHPDGIIAGYSNGGVRFIEWADLGIPYFEDEANPEPFLGEDATNEELRKMSGR